VDTIFETINKYNHITITLVFVSQVSGMHVLKAFTQSCNKYLYEIVCVFFVYRQESC